MMAPQGGVKTTFPNRCETLEWTRLVPTEGINHGDRDRSVEREVAGPVVGDLSRDRPGVVS